MLWAIDNLPWVRGRGLMLGLRLLDMDACDALDVIHVLLEEDSTFATAEARKEREEVRSIIYNDLYNRPRKHAPVPAEPEAPPGSVSADGSPVKPYMAPTDPGSLPMILGSPLN